MENITADRSYMKRREANIEHIWSVKTKAQKKTLIWVMTSSESRCYVISKYLYFQYARRGNPRPPRDVRVIAIRKTNDSQFLSNKHELRSAYSHLIYKYILEFFRLSIRKKLFSTSLLLLFCSLFTFRCHHLSSALLNLLEKQTVVRSHCRRHALRLEYCFKENRS